MANEICERIACGESLRRICQDSHLPHHTTVIRWLARHAGFLARYNTARAIQADVWRDEIYELARAPMPRDESGRIDAAELAQRRNQIDTLKWLAVKLTRKG